MAIPVIDFKTMHVLAITRCVSDKLETKVTYLNSYKREDFLYFKCSNEEHDQFASEFKDYLKCVGDSE